MAKGWKSIEQIHSEFYEEYREMFEEAGSNYDRVLIDCAFLAGYSVAFREYVSGDDKGGERELIDRTMSLQDHRMEVADYCLKLEARIPNPTEE